MKQEVTTKKVFIRTLGCQMNERDAEIILALLEKRGYQPVGKIEDADVILLNTCSVRQHAEERVWSQLGVLKKFKQGNFLRNTQYAIRNTKTIGIVGCMAQNYKDEIFRRMPHVDFVCGPANIYDIPDVLEKASKQNAQVLATNRLKRPLHTDNNFRQKNLKAFVNIMYGCNNFCSYCIVPYVRGKQLSRPAKHILDEVQALAQKGTREITLLGQNVNSYGKDLPGAINFVTLLGNLDRVKGIRRISFTTSHPKDASLELFYAMRDLAKLDKDLHLPVQSGSDRILRLMNRGYTSRHYRGLVDKYRAIVSGGRLSTDIIVGFPTETDRDFQQTHDLMKDLEFNCAYIFKYSPRSGTQAAKIKDDVPKQLKEKRHSQLLNLQKRISRKKQTEKK